MYSSLPVFMLKVLFLQLGLLDLAQQNSFLNSKSFNKMLNFQYNCCFKNCFFIRYSIEAAKLKTLYLSLIFNLMKDIIYLVLVIFSFKVIQIHDIYLFLVLCLFKTNHSLLLGIFQAKIIQEQFLNYFFDMQDYYYYQKRIYWIFCQSITYFIEAQDFY